MLPTFCELAGAESPAGIDGISFVDELLGHEQKKHEYLYWEFSARGGNQAVRMGKWKGIRKGLQKNPDAPVELYDLSKDLGEKKNIADDHPDMVARMKAMMKRSHVPSEMFPLFRRKK